MGQFPVIDSDYAAALALANRANDLDVRRLLVKAATRALEAEEMSRRLAEFEQLLAFWRTMPEHITGSTAIRQLEAVLQGGRAPSSASAPRV
jgi:hypothetical protein